MNGAATTETPAGNAGVQPSILGRQTGNGWGGKRDLIADIKSRSDCRDIFRRYWPEHFRESGNSVCPFHDDRNPSLSVQKYRAHCFGCSKNFDVIDLYGAGTGLDIGASIQALSQELGLDNEGGGIRRPKVHHVEPPEKKTQDFTETFAHAARVEPPKEVVVEFERRGLAEVLPRLRDAGVVGFSPEKGKYPPSVLFPSTSSLGLPESSIFGIQRVIPKSLAQHGRDKLFLPGSKQELFMFGIAPPVVVTEGVFDALSVSAILPNTSVAAIFSASNTKAVNWFENDHSLPVLFFDRDEAGRKATAKGVEVLRGRCRIVDWHLAPDGFKDTNELLMARHGEIIKKMVEEAKKPEYSDKSAKSNPAKASNKPWPFRTDDQGVWYAHVVVRKSIEVTDWIKVCSPLRVIALTRNSDSADWGRLIEFTDPDGEVHRWAVPISLLGGNGAELRKQLLFQGVRLGTDPKAKTALETYLTDSDPADRIRCVDRIGWHGDRFVLPDRTIGTESAEVIALQTRTNMTHRLNVAGTLDGWRDEIGRLCVGNSRLIFAVSCAFAATLVGVLGEESGGFHFRGPSSCGKTTALRLAGSVCGGGDHGYISQWRATSNALEAVALAHCDILLCLDEISQISGNQAGETAYLLANGQGKARMRSNASPRPVAQWRTLFLSTGELSLADKVSESGLRATAGQEVRVLDIPADAGASMGLFEELHGFPSADAFARHLKELTGRFYGTPVRAFLAEITSRLDGLKQQVETFRRNFTSKHRPEGADGQVLRALQRFGLVAAAGELASNLKVLPWPADAASKAAEACFRDWLEQRGTAGPQEIQAALAQIRLFLQLHGDSRFVPLRGELDETLEDSERSKEGNRPTIKRAGYNSLEHDGVHHFVFPEVFRTEVCAGFDLKFVSKGLIELGLMTPGGDGKSAANQYVSALRKPIRLYHLLPKIFES